MVRIILRALGTTLLTLAVLGYIVLARTERESGGGSSTVVVLGDLPEPLPGLGPEADGTAPQGGLPAVVGALRAYMGGEATPEPVHGEREALRPEEPEGVRVNLGRPSGAGDVQVNRGLP